MYKALAGTWWEENPLITSIFKLVTIKHNFKDLGLEAFLANQLTVAGYKSPTAVQSKAIPIILSGRDVVVESQTGTGKTAAFSLPTIQSLHNRQSKKKKKIKVLILAPTRELADQVCESYRKYSLNTGLQMTAVYGGKNIKSQFKILKKGVDILIATPGRLLDHIDRRTINLSEVETIILDEADRMLDMGFIRDIRTILSFVPQLTQNILISATFSPKIKALIRDFTKNPAQIKLQNSNRSRQLIDQFLYEVKKQSDKPKTLLSIIEKCKFSQFLIFTRTKFGAEKLGYRLKSADLKVEIIHGNKVQKQRARSLLKFKSKRVDILVATDVAARGLDIDKLPCVVNYDIPEQPDDYTHRIGRTGRAGEKGVALSIANAKEGKLVKNIEKHLGLKIKKANRDFPVPVSEKPQKKKKVRQKEQHKADR